MTRLLSLLLSAVLLAPSAFAQDTSSGCGLGWAVTQRQSLLSSAIRASTNATFLNSIAMTLGTSGCARHDLVKNEKREIHYVESNLENLAVEMAQGDGESLRGLVAVLGCAPGVYGEFSSVVQAHYSEIVGTQTTPSSLLTNLKGQIRASASLAQGCGVTI